MNTKHIWIVVVSVVVIGLIAFYGGMKYQQNKTQAAIASRFGGGVGGPGGGAGRTGGINGRGMGGGAAGTIVSKSDTGLTISLQGGGSRNVLIASSTTISKSQAGTLDDLVAGETVIVNGTANQDGSITARNLIIQPK